MSIIAKQSTARTVMVGPILDADGVAVTDAAVGDLKLSKNGAAPAALNGSATLTHRNTGHYSLALTTSDLDTVGSGQVVIDDTTNAMPPLSITIIEEAVYDALYAASATGLLPANITQISGDSTAADNLESAYDGTGYDIGGIDVSELNAIVDDWIDGGRLDLIIDAILAVIGTPAGVSIAADMVAIAEATTTTNTRLTATRAGYLDNLNGHTAQTGDSYARIGANGAGLTALPWNASWDAEVQSECADALAAYNVVATTDLPSNFGSLGINVSGHVSRVTLTDTTTTNTDMRGTDSAYTGTPPTAAAMADAVWDEARAGHTGSGTFGEHTGDAAMRGTDSANTTTPPAASAIADAVWDEAQAGHTTAGTFGKYLDSEVSGAGGGSGLTQQQVADALKLAPTAGSPAAGSVNADLDTLINRTASNVDINIVTPVATDGELTLYAGAEYSSTDGTAIAFDFSDDNDPVITGDSAILRIITQANWDAGTYTPTLELTDGVITHDGSNTATATFEATEAETALLAVAGPPEDCNYRYQLLTDTGSRLRVRISGACTVKPVIEAS